ncbi:RNA-binding domain-containing protein [Eremomyces bilateralis CBS 781.70]|uniref:RNA-binding domain-containing protein n=1 Tax=Eremomyces bilateralis CBS 781.70 TaxID=1392243 RepID=A0A6G1FXH6_9PEZI|nr:RNA-binding domain-containing protein [Eremomyces bilateralis CBS 781.70]KAF1810412.1 RNA-binding domain-containing protein [Eremomyces bilateralis CBS 781.70]
MGQKRKRQKLSSGGDEADKVPEEQQELSHAKSTLPTEEAAPHAVRSIFVRSLHPNTTSDDLTNHFSFHYPVKHAVAVLDTVSKKCRGYGFVTLTDAEDAVAAKEKLDGTTIHGKKIKTDVAEPRQRNEERTSAKPKREPVSTQRPVVEKAELPPTKLIVRNLPWTIDTAEKLSSLFRSYGKVNYAIIPKDKNGVMRGFGIVIVRGRRNAEKAIAGLNEKEIEGRTIAVDWSVGREEWQKATNDGDEGQEALPTTTQQNLVTEDDEDVTSEPNQSDDTNSSAEDDGSGSDTEEDEPEHKPAENLTSTLFVRNIPFTATDETLFEHFSQFGKLKFARVVLDPATERPRGTGFVRFVNESDATDCLKQSPKQTQAAGPGSRTNVSILQNEELDPSGKFTFDTRILQVSRAVDRNEASRLAEESLNKRNHRDRDKRRLYLLGEGAIQSSSPFYKELSQTDISMREASAKQRKKLLDSNPSLFLSLTRLSVRNIPRNVNSSDLKTLARQAVVGFAKDVKEDLRERLSKEELARGGEEMKQAEQNRKAKGTGIVKQAKIEFESSEGAKTREESGGKSRGYGFIEYHTHRSALMGLRWLNGRLAGGGAKGGSGEPKKRLIVEFAIENAQVVARRRTREEQSKQATSSNSEKTDGPQNGTIGAGVDSGSGKQLDKATQDATQDEDLAKRQRIIARKRNQRRQRKGGKP